jgi:hypothetical protein
MFLDVKDLAVRKQLIRKSYAPGSIDYQTGEMKQVEPLEVRSMPGTSGRRSSPVVRPLLQPDTEE